MTIWTRVALLLLLTVAPAAASGPLRAFSVKALGELCIVDGNGKILCIKPRDYPKIDVAARDLARAYHPIVVREDGTLVRVSGYRKQLDPIAIGFAVREAEFVGKSLCVFGEKGEFACGELDAKATKLAATPSKTRFVSVTFGYNTAWLIDDRGALWCQGSGNCARLRAAAGKARPGTSLLDPAMTRAYPKSIDTVPDASLWRVTDGVSRVHAGGDTCIELAKEPGSLTCWNFIRGPWKLPRPKADEVLVAGSHLCMRKRDTITCTFIDTPIKRPAEWKGVYPEKKPVTNSFTMKGAARLHTGGDELCVEDSKGLLACTELTGNDKMKPLSSITWAARPD